jgi:hypothetical protein
MGIMRSGVGMRV